MEWTRNKRIFHMLISIRNPTPLLIFNRKNEHLLMTTVFVNKKIIHSCKITLNYYVYSFMNNSRK